MVEQEVTPRKIVVEGGLSGVEKATRQIAAQLHEEFVDFVVDFGVPGRV